MGKRKARVVEAPEPVALPKGSKRQKHKEKVVAAEPPVEKSPKKKSREEKKLNASHISIIDEGTPKKKNKSKQAKLRNDSISSVASESSVSSPRKKHKKEKEHKKVKTPVKVTRPSIKVEEESNEEEEAVDELPVLRMEDVETKVEEPEEGETGLDLFEVGNRDLQELLRRIKQNCPDNDTMNHKLRAKKLPWDDVAFADFTGEQCAKLWDAILKKQRQFRHMAELIDDAFVWLDTPWRKKSKRHPDFPKRPKSAFLFFLEDAKPAIQREFKDAKITDVARIAGVRYKQITEKAKKVFLARATDEMRKYEERVEEFYDKYPHLRVKPKAAQKYPGPKKPLTPFLLFLEDHLEKEEHVTDKSSFKMATKGVWMNMPAKKKLAWILKAVGAHKQYMEDVEVYNFEHPNEVVKPVRSVLNKEEEKLLNKAQGKPEKPPPSAYKLFMREYMKDEEFCELPSRERVRAISCKWNQLAKEEKDAYDEKYNEMLEKYNQEYANYKKKLPAEERHKLELEEDKKVKKKADKAKLLTFTKRDVSKQIFPEHWAMMSEHDKQTYITTLNRVRGKFEAIFNDSLRQAKLDDEGAEDSDAKDEDDAAQDSDAKDDDDDDDEDAENSDNNGKDTDGSDDSEDEDSD